MDQLTVVIIAYNRAWALKRLLESLYRTNLKDYNLKFVFSLEKDSPSDVESVIKDFEFGGVDIIIHKNEERLGADAHNLAVQQLALIHGNLLILEDDHFVSPFVFDYCFEALRFYKDKQRIAAISLYPYLWVESVSVPFIPLHDGYINYYQQRPSSRGYLLTKENVIKFNQWKNRNHGKQNPLPPNTYTWKHDNWEREWYHYIIETNQFLVFPRVAYNTVFGEPGYNMNDPNERTVFQHPLMIGKSEFRFSAMEDSMAVYDSFYEFLKYEEIGITETEGDLYGTKGPGLIHKKYVIINSNHSSSIKSFGRDLKPIELNVLFNNSGNEISMIETIHYQSRQTENLENYLYFNNLFSFPSLKVFLAYYRKKIEKRVGNPKLR